ncbi:ABC transporter ATP-binding protein [Actinopolymorpha alba]|uniref:ABC transporter ATP-binding protein n=1 Tax=Actinopolymorpha alba TaxID=533267 RepID=UPI000376DFD3|nr:ABC transporter ATP-binding protein [Actinopolymorpha alba]
MSTDWTARPSATPADADAVLEIRGLRVDYGAGAHAIHAVNGVDLTLHRGEVLGVAGESGSGKSTLAYAASRLLRPPGRTVAGEVTYYPAGAGRQEPGIDVLALPPERLRKFRWTELSVVFQAAMSSLNPVLNVATQLTDALEAHRPGMTRRQCLARARELLELVNIDVARLSAYPHQLSGGQRQRIMIAMALVLEPEVIIMDEPTTSLDVVVQREILARVMELRARLDCSVIFITHDLSLLAEIADTIAVMYAGKVVEIAPAEVLCQTPSHPYSAGLLSSFPSLHGPHRTLVGIPGLPPDPRALPAGCPFHPRCGEAVAACSRDVPALFALGQRHQAACLVREAAAHAELNATDSRQASPSLPGRAER